VNAFQCLPKGVFFIIAASLGTPCQSALAKTLQRQVLIETRVVQVNDKTVRDIGFNTRLAENLAKLPPAASNLSSSNAPKFGLGPAPSAETVSSRLFPTAGDQPGAIGLYRFLTDQQMLAILNTLDREKGAKIISAPAVRTQSNQPANIQISSYGVKIEVVPRINPDGSIDMTLMVPQSAELSKDTGGSTPVIRDIPVLGAFFRNPAGGTTDLMIFVTPRIVDVLEPGESDGGGGGGSTVDVETVGAGDTIGHIADLKIRNPTDQPLNFVIPAMVLESKSRKNQDYACPDEQSVTLAAHETKTVPMDGVCVNRNKPPVGKGATGDLVINTGDPSIPQNPDSHIPANQAKDLLRFCTAKYEAADSLQKEGAFKDMPYKDKQTQTNIAIQWGTWSDPRICQITGATPATKDDLKKIVYKQIEAKGPMSKETKKKVDQGIDTIFEKVELTSEKAKDLEEPETYAQTEMPPGTFEISDRFERVTSI
jgi:hypothetical protein